jgi:hypothetical protein
MDTCQKSSKCHWLVYFTMLMPYVYEIHIYIYINLGKYNYIKFRAFRSSDASHLITFNWMIEVMVSNVEWVQSVIVDKWFLSHL